MTRREAGNMNLMLAVRALRESAHPEDFDMGCYAHKCGTPGCVLGHLAARRDLQTFLKLQGDTIRLVHLPKLYIDFENQHLNVFFDLTTQEANKLFAQNGCGDALNAAQAANYIERFVRERE